MEVGYTADDLIAAARKAGYPDLTARAITDWVQRGLLDRPTRQSKGRGQGSAKGTFPEAQKDLLLLLLDKRSDNPGVMQLQVVPIAIWLYWGDDYVPTRQVLRALTKWAKHNETSSESRAREGIEALLAQLVHPDASETARRAFNRTLMQAATSQTRIPNDLSKRISDVVDPHDEGRTPGPPGIPLNPDALVRSWLMQRRAMRKLIAGDVRNGDLERAREELRRAMAEYTLIQPLVAASVPADPYNRIQANPLELEVLVQNAAKSLLMPLAAVLNVSIT